MKPDGRRANADWTEKETRGDFLSAAFFFRNRVFRPSCRHSSHATARPRAFSVDPSRERRSFEFLDASSLSDTLEQSLLEAFVTPRRAFPNSSGSIRFFSPAS